MGLIHIGEKKIRWAGETAEKSGYRIGQKQLSELGFISGQNEKPERPHE